MSNPKAVSSSHNSAMPTMQPTTCSLVQKRGLSKASSKLFEQQLEGLLPRQVWQEYNKINHHDISQMTQTIWDNKLTVQEMCAHHRRLGFLQALWGSDPDTYRKRREQYYSKAFKAFRHSCRAHIKWWEEQTANRAGQVAEDRNQVTEQPDQVGHQSQRNAEDAAGSSKDPDWVMVDEGNDDFVMVANPAKWYILPLPACTDPVLI